jgi:hypothetical protein
MRGRYKLFYLPIDRPALFLLIAQSVVGLFRSAGGLVLLSGGKLGPQISCRSSRRMATAGTARGRRRAGGLALTSN